MFFRVFLAAGLLVSVVPAQAQGPVNLRFQDGRVTLRAENAPVRTILAEWARLGGATIVNGERLAGPPVTLELTDVPERQALDVVLRTAAGYLLAPRRAGSAGPSAFDRIVILPTSVAPRNPPPAAAAARPTVPRPIGRPPAMAEQPDEDAYVADDDGADDDPQPVVVGPIGGAPRPGMPFGRRPPMNPDSGYDIGAEVEAVDEEEAATPSPTNPFGLPYGASATPGVIAPTPQPQPQQQQRQR